MECCPRFDYGGIVPHVALISQYLGLAHGGKDAISIFSTVPMRIEEDGFLADGTLYEGGQFAVSVTYEDDIISSLEPLDEAELMGRLDETIDSGRTGPTSAPTRASTRATSFGPP